MKAEPKDTIEYLQERVTQLEWEIQKLLDSGKSTVDFEKLRAPFSEEDVEWRVQSAGKKPDGKAWAIIVPYLNARNIAERLDQVCGPQNWQDHYTEIKEGFICTLYIHGVFKSDGASATDIEGVKGGISDAFKRAAVKWGIGRYLYDFDRIYAEIVTKETPGARYGKSQDLIFYWKPPTQKSNLKNARA